MQNSRINKNLLSQPALWFGVGAIILAYHPVNWLITTWVDPAYNSSGIWIFLLVAGLFIWSWRSPKIKQTSSTPALYLLGASSLMRLLGQILAINTITALTLVIDLYALSHLAGLHARKNSLSPFWLAILFSLSLPLERILQRTVGYGLQQISAWGACSQLDIFVDNVMCEGVRIIIAGQDVLVDLPCSGARGLLLLLLAFVVISSIYKPSFKQTLIGLSLWSIAALLSNIIRIDVLALGMAFPSLIGNIDVMASPWHDLIGLIALDLGLLPLIIWAAFLSEAKRDIGPHEINPLIPKSSASFKFSSKLSRHYTYIASIVFVIAASIIVSLPASPIDIARHSTAPRLPSNILGIAGKPNTLSNQEQSYFLKFGGAAERRQYGRNSLLLVKTSAPLRHLHAPDECLRGLGHKVEYIGFDNSVIPTAVYRSTDPNGNQWRVRVSFTSDTGHTVHSVAAAVWYWMQQPGTTWYQVQRITLWQQEEKYTQQFDNAIISALDIS